MDLKDEKFQVVVEYLMTELDCQKTTPLDIMYEAAKSIYSYYYLASRVLFYKKKFKIIPKKYITGHKGQGNLDYAIKYLSTNKIISLVKVIIYKG